MKKLLFLIMTTSMITAYGEDISAIQDTSLVMGPVRKYLQEGSGAYLCNIEIIAGNLPQKPSEPFHSWPWVMPFNCSSLAGKINEGTVLVGTVKWSLNPFSHIERWELHFHPTGFVSSLSENN